MSKEKLVKEAELFEETNRVFKSRNEKIIASRAAKKLILSLNEIYKETKDPELMDIMKRITEIKKKAERRL